MVMQPLPTRLVLQKKKAKEGRFGDDVEHYPVPSRITVRRGSVVSVEEVKDSVGVSSSHVCILYLFHLTDPLQYIYSIVFRFFILFKLSKSKFFILSIFRMPFIFFYLVQLGFLMTCCLSSLVA